MTDTERRIRDLEDEVRYLRRRLDDAIARPLPVAPQPYYPSLPVQPSSPSVPPGVEWFTDHWWIQRGPTCEPIL